MAQAIIEKSVGGKFPIGLKYYSPDLESGETISAASATAPAGLTVGAAVIDANEISVEISGGTVDKNYKVQFKMTTSSGKIFNHPIKDSIIVKVVS